MALKKYINNKSRKGKRIGKRKEERGKRKEERGKMKGLLCNLRLIGVTKRYTNTDLRTSVGGNAAGTVRISPYCCYEEILREC
jgi:hypothetical protein